MLTPNFFLEATPSAPPAIGQDSAAFANAIWKGLSAEHKYIESRFLYDRAGSHIYSDIERQPEYYPYACELEIFQMQAIQLGHSLVHGNEPLAIIEIGAGDASKTRVLLRHLLKSNLDIVYVPTDIDSRGLQQLQQQLEAEFQGRLPVQPQALDLQESMPNVTSLRNRRHVYLWLGTSIGNYSHEQATALLKRIKNQMEKHDLLLLGMDLIKNPQTILAAYNDAAGVTRAFNHNVLQRINQELDANFRIGKFQHFPLYDPVTAQARSYLVSTENQVVILGKLNKRISFRAGEAIHTETSQKYDIGMINQLLRDAGLQLYDLFSDSRRYFASVVART